MLISVLSQDYGFVAQYTKQQNLLASFANPAHFHQCVQSCGLRRPPVYAIRPVHISGHRVPVKPQQRGGHRITRLIEPGFVLSLGHPIIATSVQINYLSIDWPTPGCMLLMTGLLNEAVNMSWDKDRCLNRMTPCSLFALFACMRIDWSPCGWHIEAWRDNIFPKTSLN